LVNIKINILRCTVSKISKYSNEIMVLYHYIVNDENFAIYKVCYIKTPVKTNSLILCFARYVLVNIRSPSWVSGSSKISEDLKLKL